MYLTDEQAADIWQQGHEAWAEHQFDPANTEARDLAHRLFLALVLLTKRRSSSAAVAAATAYVLCN